MIVNKNFTYDLKVEEKEFSIIKCALFFSLENLQRQKRENLNLLNDKYFIEELEYTKKLYNDFDLV